MLNPMPWLNFLAHLTAYALLRSARELSFPRRAKLTPVLKSSPGKASSPGRRVLFAPVLHVELLYSGALTTIVTGSGTTSPSPAANGTRSPVSR